MSSGIVPRPTKLYDKISELQDVANTPQPTNGDVLKWNAATGQYIPTPGNGLGQTLGILSNTNPAVDTLGAAEDGNVLAWDNGASHWTHVPAGSGPTGATGPQGIQGATGPTGPAGVDGATGATGAQGIQGIAGATGATGAQGVQGIAGATGATGAQGVQGIAGATGATGPQGIQGVQGIAGATGATGPEGPITTWGGLTNVDAGVDSATLFDMAYYNGGAGWSRTSYQNYVERTNDRRRHNENMNLLTCNQADNTPNRAEIAAGSPTVTDNLNWTAVTEIYINYLDNRSPPDFTLLGVGQDNAAGDIIRVSKLDGVVSQLRCGYFRINSITQDGGNNRFVYTVTYLNGTGTFLTGQSYGVSFFPTSSLFNSITSINNARNAYAQLSCDQNALTSAVGAVGSWSTLQTAISGGFGGTQFNQPQPYSIRWLGASTIFQVTLSIACFANQVDRVFEFTISKNGVQQPLRLVNYATTNTARPEQQSTSTELIGLATNDVVTISYRLNEATLPSPTTLTVETARLLLRSI